MNRRTVLLGVVVLLILWFLSGIFYFTTRKAGQEGSRKSTMVQAEVKR